MIIGSIWISKNYALEVAEIPTTCCNLKLKSMSSIVLIHTTLLIAFVSTEAETDDP
ncbi:hypothetical protein F2Q70_00008811 [Brassica cretica]|uniref:Uncharacterized protein n=1 Tax=Brassica cretica TaxID=69181 RepID=A0A8S9MAB5_BRACR|nr:hypothetical protein F2Q70_00008811 [Brassica cretica]